MSDTRDRIRDWVNSFGDPLTLYREVYLVSPSSLDTKHLGSSWTPEKDRAHSPYGKLDHKKGAQPYILTIRAPRSVVDENGTVTAMKRWPGEREIRLKKGAKVKFIDLLDSSGQSVVMRKPSVSVASLAQKLTLRGDAEAALLILEARNPKLPRKSYVQGFDDVDEEGLAFPETKEARAAEIFQIPTADELREKFRRYKHHGRPLNEKEVEIMVRNRLKRLNHYKTQQKAKQAVDDAKRNFQREKALGPSYKKLLDRVRPNPSRDLTPFHDVYEDAESQEEINAIAAGQLIPYGWTGPFKPIEVVISNEVADPYIEDGNHRLKAALQHGADYVRVQFAFREDGLTVQTVTAVVPL